MLKNSELLVGRPKSVELNNMYSNFALIPSLYAMSIVIGFVSVRVATIFPVYHVSHYTSEAIRLTIVRPHNLR